MKKQAYIFLLLALFGLTTCVEPIDFDKPDEAPLVTAFGTFSSGNDTHELRLKYSKPAIGNGDFITNATVLLREQESNATWSYNYLNERYILSNKRGEAGKNYRIEIQLADGLSYYSEWQLLPENQSNMSLRHTIEGNSIRVWAEVPVSNETVYLRFPFEEDYSFPEVLCFPLDQVLTCYFNVPRIAQNIPLFSNENIQIDTLRDFLVYEDDRARTKNMEFRLEHYYSVFVHAISPEAYAYWEKVNQIGNLSGDIFDPIPAAITGNIYNANDETDRLLGFFEVAAVDTIRTVVLPGDLPQTFFATPFCKPIVGGVFPEGFNFACCNCGTLAGAGFEKPYWF